MNKIIIKDHSSSLFVWLEPVLWLFLSVFGCFHSSYSWSSVLVVVTSIIACRPGNKNDTTSCIWRRQVSSLSTQDAQGCSMKAVAVPLLLEAFSRHAVREEDTQLYAKLICLTTLATTLSITRSFDIALGSIALILDPSLRCWKSFVLVAVYAVLSHGIVGRFRGLYQVFTLGEWHVISGLVAVAVTESTFCLIEGPTDLPLYAVVSLSGMAGCGVGCALAAKIGSSSKSFPVSRGLVLISLPFVIIEAALWWSEYKASFLPRCVSWIVEFIMESESNNNNNVPRALWLLYWALVLVVALPLAQRLSPYYSVVVARKWFHFVALLLFGPVTILAPQLMSLSHAIALSLLMVLENVRPWLPAAIQEFYGTFLHLDKDKPHQVVVTHMALIAGCALPLWISQLMGHNGILLPLWGCICLGVGDSMGALVGSSVLGRTRWHAHSTRTIEGSFAVWFSTAVTCHVLVGNDEPWLAAVTCVTLLEAWTLQIDNLILPLAGATVILMQQGGRNQGC